MTSTCETRDRILDAGTRAFVAKSYNGCGLNEILCSAGVPKGSFYHYFKSKEDFGVAVIEASVNQKLEVLKEHLSDRSRSPVDRIRSFYEMLRNCYEESGPRRECLIAKLALETAQLSEPMRKAIKRGYERWASILTETIQEAQEAGEIPKDADARQIADLLVNTWEGATIRMQINEDMAPVHQFIDYFLDRVLMTT